MPTSMGGAGEWPTSSGFRAQEGGLPLPEGTSPLIISVFVSVGLEEMVLIPACDSHPLDYGHILALCGGDPEPPCTHPGRLAC